MLTAKVFLWVYAILMLGGGYMGYKKSGSKMSLIMGSVSCLVISIGLQINKTNATAGFTLITLMIVLLTGTFTTRLIKTKKFMPSGMLLALSVLALIVSIKQLI